MVHLSRKWLICIFSLNSTFIPSHSFAIENIKDSTLIPITTVFYGMDRNLIGSLSYNFGLNYMLAGAGTYGIVKSGIDWSWYRNAQDHKWISQLGFVFVGVGPLVSIAVPGGLYIYGRSNEDYKLQLTGLAMGQAAILAALTTSVLKAFTGRVPPDNETNMNDYSGDFRFGFLRGGIYEGWPSSHTATAFAMATTLMELYPENTTIKYCGWGYASLIGIGVSTNIHWFSDAVAGALIGYAIGTMVGNDFRNLVNHTNTEKSYGFYITPTGLMFVYHF